MLTPGTFPLSVSTVMKAIRNAARLFWVCALLLIATGQASHAYEDWAHSPDHSAECRSTGKAGDPIGHSTCCHSHCHGIGTVPVGKVVTSGPVGVEVYFDREDSLVEGPAREIDHPPQLS